MPQIFSFVNPLSGMSANSVNLTIALTVDVLAVLFIAHYLLFSFGIFQLAYGRKETNRWIAFVPFIRLAYFSRMADEIFWKQKKQSVLSTLSFVTASGCIIAASLYIINDRFPFLHSHSTLIFGGCFLLFFIAGVIGLYWAAAVLWKEIEPEHFTMMLVFSLIAPLTYGIFVYRIGLAAMDAVRKAPDDIPKPPAEKDKKPFVVHLPDEAL